MLERELDAERVVLEGYGHTAQRPPGFNDVLADFVDRASAAESPGQTSPRSHKKAL